MRLFIVSTDNGTLNFSASFGPSVNQTSLRCASFTSVSSVLLFFFVAQLTLQRGT